MNKFLGKIIMTPLFLTNMYFFGEVETEKGLTMPFKVFAKDHPEFILEEQLRRYIVENFLSANMTVKFISIGKGD